MKSYTKMIMADAFEQLLHEKNFEDITISDIVNKCGASRSTFYKHFSDKYEIMIWKYKEALTQIHNEDKSVDDWQEGTLAGIQYLADNRTYFLKIIDYKGQNSIHDFLLHFAIDFTKGIMCKKHNTDWIPEKDFQALRVWLMGTTQYIMEWLKNMNMTPEELAELMCDCRPRRLKDYFN